jgi:hypothetical protein
LGVHITTKPKAQRRYFGVSLGLPLVYLWLGGMSCGILFESLIPISKEGLDDYVPKRWGYSLNFNLGPSGGFRRIFS